MTIDCEYSCHSILALLIEVEGSPGVVAGWPGRAPLCRSIPEALFRPWMKSVRRDVLRSAAPPPPRRRRREASGAPTFRRQRGAQEVTSPGVAVLGGTGRTGAIRELEDAIRGPPDQQLRERGARRAHSHSRGGRGRGAHVRAAPRPRTSPLASSGLRDRKGRGPRLQSGLHSRPRLPRVLPPVLEAGARQLLRSVEPALPAFGHLGLQDPARRVPGVKQQLSVELHAERDGVVESSPGRVGEVDTHQDAGRGHCHDLLPILFFRRRARA